MLCQFTVKNFRSIKDEVTFDMQAVAISEHEDRVIVTEDGEKFLPIAAVYGPNGGGKSNVLAAISNLVLMIMRPILAIKIGQDNPLLNQIPLIEPFAFSGNDDGPTEFEVFFRTDIAEYRYVLHVNRNVIIYESLDRIKFDTHRRSDLFERSEEGLQLKGDLSKLKISSDLSKNLPLISYLGITYENNEIVNDAINWFKSGMILLNYGNPYNELSFSLDSLETYKDLLLDMIKEMDLDIVDFRVEKKDNNRIEVYTKHCIEGRNVELTLDKESSGTQKIFSMLPLLTVGLLDGRTLIVDELDAKLHPLLLKHLIMMFNDMSINRHNAQLIFTSHDLSTMTNEIFRRDEIWFVAKGNEQNSQLYSLVDFKTEEGKSVRKDAKFDKQYLEGKYGADPYLRRIIDWSNYNA